MPFTPFKTISFKIVFSNVFNRANNIFLITRYYYLHYLETRHLSLSTSLEELSSLKLQIISSTLSPILLNL